MSGNFPTLYLLPPARVDAPARPGVPFPTEKVGITPTRSYAAAPTPRQPRPDHDRPRTAPTPRGPDPERPNVPRLRRHLLQHEGRVRRADARPARAPLAATVARAGLARGGRHRRSAAAGVPGAAGDPAPGGGH